MSKEPGKFAIDAMLCDSCVVSEGKMFVLGGGWDNLASPAYPFAQARIGLAMVVEIPWTETNRNHDLEIRLVTQGEGEEPLEVRIGPRQRADDGGVVQEATIRAVFNTGRPPHLASGDSQKLPIALNLDGLQIPAPGLYSFEVKIDTIEVNRLSFRAMPPPGINLSSPGRR